MTRTASVCHSRGGYLLRLDEVPLWALVGEWAIDHVILPATFHLVCCNIPEWTFRAGFGREGDGTERWCAHSLGGALYGIGNWLGTFICRHETPVWERPLTFAEVCLHFPSARVDWDDDGVDFSRGVMLPEPQEEHGEYGVIA